MSGAAESRVSTAAHAPPVLLLRCFCPGIGTAFLFLASSSFIEKTPEGPARLAAAPSVANSLSNGEVRGAQIQNYRVKVLFGLEIHQAGRVMQ